MTPSQFSMLSPTRLTPAGGMEPPACQPQVRLLHGKEGDVPSSVNAIRVDPVVAFNELVHGLFLGSPPWCMEHLHEAVEISKNYQDIANQLKNTGDIDGYYRFAQAAAFLKKYEGMSSEDETKACDATLVKWVGCETINAQNNRLFWEMAQRPLTHTDVERRRLIEGVKAEIHRLIGEFPPEMSDVSRYGRFGPGVSLSHKIDSVDPILKCINPTALISQRDEVSWLFENTLMGRAAFSSYTGLSWERCTLPRYQKVAIALEGVEWVNYERYATVPKNVEVRRSIGVGASLATWIQQAYDGWLRGRLRNWGLDLSNQEPNRSLAYLGSLSKEPDRPCTIDLTDASSRICVGLIASVFSKPWARTLFRQRAQFCALPGGEHRRLEMFSAMGNALTFSLQTLIFSAVVRVVLRTHRLNSPKWRVYGDDIIVPHSCFDAVTHSLTLLGFEPNLAKSFKEGYFRESCGADYLHGTNVRPLYFKRPVEDVSDLYKVINLVQLYAAESPIPVWCYRRLYKYLLSTVPKDFLVFGEPSTVLDGYIWAPSVGRLPRRILGKSNVSETLPQRWGYLRALLTGTAGDSHVRVRKGLGVFCLANLTFFRRVSVSYTAPGVTLPGVKWRWARVLSLDSSRLKGLASKLLPLFI